MINVVKVVWAEKAVLDPIFGWGEFQNHIVPKGAFLGIFRCAGFLIILSLNVEKGHLTNPLLE